MREAKLCSYSAYFCEENKVCWRPASSHFLTQSFPCTTEELWTELTTKKVGARVVLNSGVFLVLLVRFSFFFCHYGDGVRLAFVNGPWDKFFCSNSFFVGGDVVFKLKLRCRKLAWSGECVCEWSVYLLLRPRAAGREMTQTSASQLVMNLSRIRPEFIHRYSFGCSR